MTIPEALDRLSQSRFRGSFHLNAKLREIVQSRGMDAMREFAAERVRKCLAPAEPLNDGRQTPMKNHPVFLAQHATGSCCRGCLNRWWHVPKGIALTEVQQEKVVNLIVAWIERQMES